MGYSAKNAKQILELKVQQDRIRAEAEKKKALQEKERSDILKKLQQQANKKLNQISSEVIEAAISDKVSKVYLDKKISTDLILRGEFNRRGFKLDWTSEEQDPSEGEYLPKAQEMLEALVEIEKLALYTADQVERVVKKYESDYVVLSLTQVKEIISVIDGKFSKKFDSNNLKYRDYLALCKKFDEIQNLSIFDYGFDDELDYPEYSKEISPSENIKEIVYDLGDYEVRSQVKLGELFLCWKSSTKESNDYKNDFFTAQKVSWISSKNASKFIENILDKIQDHALDGKTSMRLYVTDSWGGDCEVGCDNKVFINYPYSLESMLDLFKRLGYQIKDKKLKQVNDDIQGTVSIAWS